MERVKTILVSAMAGLFSKDCSHIQEQRLLAVGGIHIFEGQSPCRLVSVEPEGAGKDLKWLDALAFEAMNEGTVRIMCGTEKIIADIVAPARLEIELVSDGEVSEIAVNERFKVRARLYDQRGRGLEVGKFTNFEWSSSEGFEVTTDRSSGEFGFCDTCYGMYIFRAVKPGKGSILVRLGRLQGMLKVLANH